MNLRVLMIAGLAALWAVGAFAFITLPPASKYPLLIIPGVGTLAFVILNWTLVSGNIRVNVPFEIPPENMERVQAVAAQMLEVLGSLLLIGFACIESIVYQSSASSTQSLAFPYVIGTFVALILAVVVVTLVRIRQVAR